jgi:hypothetical protein
MAEEICFGYDWMLKLWNGPMIGRFLVSAGYNADVLISSGTIAALILSSSVSSRDGRVRNDAGLS